MFEKDNPCKKDCPERTTTCHGTCKRYAKYYQRNREKNKRNIMIINSISTTQSNMVFKKSSMHGEVGSYKKPEKTRRRT